MQQQSQPQRGRLARAFQTDYTTQNQVCFYLFNNTKFKK